MEFAEVVAAKKGTVVLLKGGVVAQKHGPDRWFLSKIGQAP